tara:strand:+ start:4356 stop:4835 length:480 start_codon:yes stop_codon:yes gene_type:complete
MDPMTLFAAVSSSFQIVKKLVNAGKEFEDVSQQIGKWMGACSDLEHAHNKLKNPSLLTRLKKGSSIQTEAAQLVLHRATIEKQRDELQHHIIWTLGLGQKGWDALLDTERQIRVQRKKEKYEREARKEKIQFWVVLIIVMFVGVGLLIALAYGLKLLDN